MPTRPSRAPASVVRRTGAAAARLLPRSRRARTLLAVLLAGAGLAAGLAGLVVSRWMREGGELVRAHLAHAVAHAGWSFPALRRWKTRAERSSPGSQV